MRKMLVAFVILSVIVGATLWENSAVESICTHMSSRLDAIEKELDEESKHLHEITVELIDTWHEKEKILDVLIPHEDTDEINEAFSDFYACIKKGEYNTAYIILKGMQEQFDHIHEKSKINITNIF